MATFTVTDPGEFDGTSYQVAERACLQLLGLIQVLKGVIPATEVQLRNAEFDRALAMESDLFELASNWEQREHPQPRQFDTITELLNQTEAKVRSLSKAAGFNPKARLPKE